MLWQHPAPRSGRHIDDLPDDVADLWRQIRDAQAADAPALAVMGCRKMLIHLAEDASRRDVESGEVEGEPLRFGRFTNAVVYLEEHHWLPKGAQKIAHAIKEDGDEVNHLRSLPDQKEADTTIRFTATVLANMYEVPSDFHGPATGTEEVIAEADLDDPVNALPHPGFST